MSRFLSSDRHYMFEDVDRWGPLTSFNRHYTSLGCSNEPTSPDVMSNFKVSALFDCSLMENDYNRKKIIQLDGIVPIIEDENDPDFKGDSCRLEHRRRTEGTAVESNYSMEVPVALTRYLRPSLKFDIVTTKTFLAMLCRFIGNERRFYRFNIERIGNLIIVEEALFGDARPFKTYLQGALDILTGRPAKPKKPIEVMCRSFQRFSFENLQMKWPNMVFSGADRIISVLHVRGLIDHKPKGYKNTMARASELCRHIFDHIKAIRSPDCDKMALIWVNDKQLPLDVNDGNHLVLYRRHLSGRALDESAFVSPLLHASILRTIQ